jgi:flagellar hook assembly protein FlgD
LDITSNGGNRTLPVTILVSNTVRVDGKNVEVPRAFSLEQNYPNPFWSETTSPARSGGNPETTIRYALPHEGNVSLTVFDLNGRRVALLESGLKTAGQHFIRWNGRDSAGKRVPSGVYFYRLEAASPAGTATVLTKKMTVMK